ncbi:hypothetical protein COCCADRAFT_100682, partial [Bipolaris zeicola 26-R-13]
FSFFYFSLSKSRTRLVWPSAFFFFSLYYFAPRFWVWAKVHANVSLFIPPSSSQTIMSQSPQLINYMNFPPPPSRAHVSSEEKKESGQNYRND